MRISDWSSDVCSSDLFCVVTVVRHDLDHAADEGHPVRMTAIFVEIIAAQHEFPAIVPDVADQLHFLRKLVFPIREGGRQRGEGRAADVGRSEEHTSELQSLMRISYAVFCLKKKTEYTDTTKQNK